MTSISINPSAAPSSSAPSSVAAVCTHANLSPIYGVDKAKLVIKYAVDDFAPFVDNFATPMRAQIQRGQSQGLLLTMQHTQPNNVKCWLGVFFPPAFPQRGPQTAVLLSPTQSVRQGHPIIAPNGAVRMELLDCGVNPDQLLNILVSMIVVLDADNPIMENAVGGAPAASRGYGSANVAPPAGAAGAAPPSSATAFVDDDRSIVLTDEQQKLHELFVSDYFKLNDKYLAVRMETVAHHEVLQAAAEGLRKERESLQQEVDLLSIAAQEQSQLTAAIEAYHSNNSVIGSSSAAVPLDRLTATDVIEPENELHGQALELLATVNAHEDQLSFLERCLSRRAITAEVYLRMVNQIAREEFQSRYLYHRAIDKVNQPKSLAALGKKFNPKGLDEQVVASVLAANAFNPTKAEKALADMVS